MSLDRILRNCKCPQWLNQLLQTSTLRRNISWPWNLPLSRWILTKNWTYKSFRRPSYSQNWASVVLLRTMEEAQGGLVGALEIPAADASEDLPPESEPILCCIWPAGQPIRIKEVRSRDQSASLLQSKLRSAADHCLPLSFACNPYHGKFWERRQGNLLDARS